MQLCWVAIPGVTTSLFPRVCVRVYQMLPFPFSCYYLHSCFKSLQIKLGLSHPPFLLVFFNPHSILVKKLRLGFRINIVAKCLLGGINIAVKCPLVGGREEERWILELFCLRGKKNIVCQQLYLKQNGASSFGMAVREHLKVSFSLPYFYI